jgi:hypothetical protein
MIVLVLPVAQLRGELGDGPEGRPAVEFLLVGAVAPLDLAIGLRAPRWDVAMADPQVAEVPREVGAELVPVVGLNPLDGQRQPLADFVDERDSRRDRGVGVDLQDPVARGLIDRRELVEATAAQLQVLDVDLDGLAGDGELSAAPRARSVPLEGDPRDMMAPEDFIDGGDGDVDLWYRCRKRQIRIGPYWRPWRTWSTRA